MVIVRMEPPGLDSCYDDSDSSLFDISLQKQVVEDPEDDSLFKAIREEQKFKSSIAEPQKCELDAMILDRVQKRSSLGINEPKRMSVKKLEYILSPLEIVLICPLLEECIRKLSIMISRCPKVKVYFDFLDIYERFTENQEYSIKSLVDRENISPQEKFAHDVNAKFELFFRSYSPLFDGIETIEESTEERWDVIWSAFRENRVFRGRLQKLLRMIKDDLQFEEHNLLTTFITYTHMKVMKLSNIKSSNINLNKKLENLKADIMHLHNLAENTKKNETSLNLYRQEIYDEKAIKIGTLVEYLKKYDKGRIEQNRLKMEQNLKKELAKAAMKSRELEEEITSHEAIMSYCKRSQTELESSIEFWENKYLKDMEDIGLRMDVLDEETGENSSFIQRLLEAFNQRKMEMDMYEKEKEEMFERETLEEMMESLLLALKAWWRGSMARWDLGQYDPNYGRQRQQEERAALVAAARGPSEREGSSSSSEEESPEQLPVTVTGQEQEVPPPTSGQPDQ